MSEAVKSFFDRYRLGEATAEDIHNYIGHWHDSPTSGPKLHEFLGLTWPEYAAWVMDDDALDRILDARKAGRPIDTVPERLDV